MNNPAAPAHTPAFEAEINSFFSAINCGNAEAVRQFLDKYPSAIEETDNYGATALVQAAIAGVKETVSLLLERGASVDAECRNGVTALMWCAEAGHNEIIALLLEKGADVNHRDDIGETALMMAALNEEKETVELLLEKGADAGIKDREGQTALMIAQEMEDDETVTVLQRWHRKQEQVKERQKFMQETDCSSGLKHDLPATHPLKLPPRPRI